MPERTGTLYFFSVTREAYDAAIHRPVSQPCGITPSASNTLETAFEEVDRIENEKSACVRRFLVDHALTGN
jgi:hypothetical protein